MLDGHGDEVAVVGAHYPADTAGRDSTVGKLLWLDSVDTTRAMRAILSVFVLDSFIPHSAECMQVNNEPETLPNVQREVQAEVDRAVGTAQPFAAVTRKDFYDAAKKSYLHHHHRRNASLGCPIIKPDLNPVPAHLVPKTIAPRRSGEAEGSLASSQGDLPLESLTLALLRDSDSTLR